MANRNRQPRRYGQSMSTLDILGIALAVGVALGFGAAMGYIVILKFELLQAAATYLQTH